MVPILLLTGFLGAGKTTFLNWLLKSHPDLKISIILNEFGDTPLESQFVQQKTENVVELANGCMCCVAKSDIPRVVAYILEHSPQTEYIIIEASGLSDPDPVHEALRTPPVSNQTYLESTVCIIDAMNFETMRTQNSIVTSQIADADLVVISKVNEAGLQQVTKVQSQLESLTPDVRVLTFTESLNSLIFLTHTRPQSAHAETTLHHHTHDQYQIFEYRTTTPLQIKKLAVFIDELPQTIIRIKGVVHCIDESNNQFWVQVQRVGSHSTVENYSPHNQPENSVILFIGKEFDELAIENSLNSFRQTV